MNAMTRFTVKSLRANRVRTLVTIAGVALAAALLCAVLTTYASLQSMLYQTEKSISGEWMAVAQSDDRTRLDSQIAYALEAGSIGKAATLQDAGFGELTPEQQRYHGPHLPIASFSGDIGTLCAVHPSEGRLPQEAGEIMLFETWSTSGDDTLEIGDTLTLPVGQRRAVLAPGREGTLSKVASPADWENYPDIGSDEGATQIEAGMLLDSSIGILDSALDGGPLNEELVDTEERTYTVVGFYDLSAYATSAASGMKAFTVDDPAAAGATKAFVTFNGAGSTAEIEKRAEESFPESSIELHTSMLRYMGILPNGGIRDTVVGIASVLAVVIIVACVSLIYNAFAISVAERSGQFGLLASVGASRRQLRRAVLIEAFSVALIGIPAGLLIGIGGCAVTFAALGPSLASIFGAAEVGFALTVPVWVLAIAAGLTLATVLFSVFGPAWRASRANVIDALRGKQNSRTSKRGAARAAKAADPAQLWKHRGLAGRAFGMGGLIARINGKRGTSRGTAASVSLALAIVLLMTAGSLSTFLGTLADVASSGNADGDVTISSAFLSEDDPRAARGSQGQGTEDALARANQGKGAPAAGSAELATPEAAMRAANTRFADEAATFERAYQDLSTVPGAEPLGWVLEGHVPAIVPESMIGDVFQGEGFGEGGRMADGRYASSASVTYVDDAAFDRYAQQHGADAASFHDPEHPRAIGIAKAYGNNGSVYELMDALRTTGTVDMIVGGTYEGTAVSGFSIYADATASGLVYQLKPYILNGSGDGTRTDGASDADSSSGKELDLNEVELTTIALDIAMLVDETPSFVSMNGGQLRFIVPMSLAQSQGFGIDEPTFTATFDALQGHSADVSEDLVDRAGTFFHDETDYEVAYLGMQDRVVAAESNRMLATVINVFCLLFTIILALIALGNVFNTVTNGLILRRREFAVMRSVGLSNRQFRSMIMDECAAWCLRGLVPGIALSLGVSFLLWRSVTNSIAGLGFALPWGYVALAGGLTAATIAISVAYGMHRCKADNVVEALRMDSI